MGFDLDYNFHHPKEVVARGKKHGKYLRVNPGKQSEADGNGGTGKFARWQVELIEKGKYVKLKSKHTGKYLRLDKGEVDVTGTGGPWTKFKVHKIDNNEVKLESDKHPGKYVAIQGGGAVRIGTGGPWCNLVFFRDN